MREDEAIARRVLREVEEAANRFLCGRVVKELSNHTSNSTVRESRSSRSGISIPDMDVEKTIADVELLEHLYTLPDTRPLRLADREAANQKHDEMLADNPWFRLWKRYGI